MCGHPATAWQHLVLHSMCQSSDVVGLQALAILQQALWWWPSTRTHTYGAAVHAEPRRAAALAAAATRAKKKRKEREDIATAHLVSPAHYINLYQSSTLPADATCFPAMHQQPLTRPCCAATKLSMLHDLGQHNAATWLLLFFPAPIKVMLLHLAASQAGRGCVASEAS